MEKIHNPNDFPIGAYFSAPEGTSYTHAVRCDDPVFPWEVHNGGSVEHWMDLSTLWVSEGDNPRSADDTSAETLSELRRIRAALEDIARGMVGR